MRVLLINPNTNSSVTKFVAGHLQRCLGTMKTTGTDSNPNIIERTASLGSDIIATPEAFEIGAQSACDVLAQSLQDRLEFDCVLLACFGDPGLEKMQGLLNESSFSGYTAPSIKVVGLAQASMLYAEELQQPFAVVTCGSAWQPILNKRFSQWGSSSLYRGTFVVPKSGQEIFASPANGIDAICGAIEQARAHGAKQIILGGAVLIGVKRLMTQLGKSTTGLIDCLECAASEILFDRSRA